jgi:hypothetical protein
MKYCLLLFFFILHLIGFAQHKSKPMAVVAATNNNYIYRIFDNPLSISVSGHYNKDIVVKTSIGKIEYINYNSYNLNVGKCLEKSVRIFVKLKNKKLKLISSSLFALKAIPKPNICLGSNCANSLLFYNNLQKINFIYTILDFQNTCSLRYDVKEFKVKHIKTNGDSSIFQNNGQLINSEIKESFKNAEDGDTIIINNVSVIGPSGLLKLTDELFFVIKKP